MNFITPQWPCPATVHAVVSTRSGGVSQAPFDSLNLGNHVGDRIEHVLANRAILSKALPAEPLWLKQIHGVVVSTPQSRQLNPSDVLEADASVSNTPGEVLVILTADCLPVLFSNRMGTVVGAAHAGWRGLCSGILENTLAQLLAISAGTTVDDIIVWLGPAIGPESFEVGEDVVNAFKESELPFFSEGFQPIPNKVGKFLANIYLLARRRLEACGVRAIFGGEFCTVRDQEQFFSYRRNGQTGRFASAIWLSK